MEILILLAVVLLGLRISSSLESVSLRLDRLSKDFNEYADESDDEREIRMVVLGKSRK